jgi:putrescine transport system ATP-binding protein
LLSYPPKKVSFHPSSPWHNLDSQPFIRIEGVSKNFGSIRALENVNLHIYRGEFFSLLGPSGCGKTTLLRMLAGFEHPSAGRVYIDGIDVTETPPYRLPVNMMFQSYALFPHMSVWKNVAFGLKQQKLPPKEIAERVWEMLELVHMQDLADRRPQHLSGGQKQRVALARSLARHPKVLLLDEPLGALDKNLREKTRLELVNIQEKVGITFVMVTHDQEEAMTVSTRMGIMENGHICQAGTPSEIYEYPKSVYVAQFIGTINILEGIITGETGEEEYITVKSPHTATELTVAYTASVPMGGAAFVAVRPEKIMMFLEPPLEPMYNLSQGIVVDIAYLGDVSIYHVRLFSGYILYVTQVNTVRLSDLPVTWDDTVYVSWRPENSVILSP